MGMIRAIRMMNGLVDGTIAGTQLEEMLTTGGRKGDFTQLLALSSYVQILANSAPALDAILLGATVSATARAALLGAPNARNLMFSQKFAIPRIVAASSAVSVISADATLAAETLENAPFLSALSKSRSGMAAFASTSVGRLALWSSDKALDAIYAESEAREGLRTVSGFTIVSGYADGSSSNYPTNGLTVGKRLIIGAGMAYNSNTNAATVSVGTGYGRQGTARSTGSAAFTGAAAANQPFGDQAKAALAYPFERLSTQPGPSLYASPSNVTCYIASLPV